MTVGMPSDEGETSPSYVRRQRRPPIPAERRVVARDLFGNQPLKQQQPPLAAPLSSAAITAETYKESPSANHGDLQSEVSKHTSALEAPLLPCRAKAPRKHTPPETASLFDKRKRIGGTPDEPQPSTPWTQRVIRLEQPDSPDAGE